MSKYSKLENAYGSRSVEENFFMSYALRGSVVIPGTRQGMPTAGPIDGPVSHPSPLNVDWRREMPFDNLDGIF